MTQKLVRHHCHNFYKMMEQDMPTDHYLMLMRLLVFFLSLAGLQVREKQSNSSELKISFCISRSSQRSDAEPV